MSRPVHARQLVSGTTREEAFAALLDVHSVPEWAFGVSRISLLDGMTVMVPGVSMEFVLNAAGFTHEVVSIITVLQAPQVLEWRYVHGAVGGGGWMVEEAGPRTVEMTLWTDYEVRPAWLNAVAHRPFFRRVTEDLLRRSMRRLGQRLSGRDG
ncbi:MAG: SRPBCC family protein [Rubrobacteraceae bacterium]|nr:SRPBCC family protein [Rubrobacter sp.]